MKGRCEVQGYDSMSTLECIPRGVLVVTDTAGPFLPGKGVTLEIEGNRIAVDVYRLRAAIDAMVLSQAGGSTSQ